jgi:hypothetical protein
MAALRARRVDVPATILAEHNLIVPSYACAFEIETTSNDSRTAEQWLRAMFEDAPPLLRAFILSGWLGALRLRLGPRPSPAHIIGWKILTVSPTKIVITVDGSILSACQVVQVDEAKVIHVTIVHFDRPAAKPIWAVAAPIHIRTIPHLMKRVRANASAGS